MNKRSKTVTRAVAAFAATYIAAFAIVAVRAQAPTPMPIIPPTTLKSVVVPEPPDLADFVQDRAAAIALGKALFWDMQAGSDNLQACATCHFHAGADYRVKNVLNPNLNNVAGQPTSTTFDPMATGNKGGPNYTVKAGDFPFHRLQDPTDRESIVMYDTNDVTGSAGVFNSDFGRVLTIFERNKYAPDGVFQVGTAETRRVEPRNTPSVINAALNYRNFWDGRANSTFNGVTPFGPRDQTSRIWLDDYYTDPKTHAQVERAIPVATRIPYASAASQAVGPALSAFEMSAAGRQFSDLGHKFLTTPRPMFYQQVSATDSVLGKYRHSSGFGLNTTYEAMIKAAFWSDYWQVPDAVFKASSGTTYRQIEANFSLFWGLAIQMYESTLISDDSRFDQFSDDPVKNANVLTTQEKQGLALFVGKGKCVQCHKGAELTGAATRQIGMPGGEDGVIERMIMGDFQTAIYDSAFYNIGVVPAGNDVGVGGSDPFGNPLSYTREYKQMLAGKTVPEAFSFEVNPCKFSVDRCFGVFDANARDAADGAFKVPSLRNVELTGPYFHTGGYATLEQVVEFYSRGGNRRAATGGDTTGLNTNGTNLAPDIQPLNLTAAEQAALVAFLKSLTDERVRWEKAPFDHPGLIIPHGAVGDNVKVLSIAGRAMDQFMTIPAVGAAGLGALKLQPIQPFSPPKQ